MLLRFLFGDDIFISYSRKDGANYAAALANELSKPGRDFSCFLDQWGASAANELSKPVLRALRRSSVLVLVGTQGAINSKFVRQEVESFSQQSWPRAHRPILPINIDGALDRVDWEKLTGLDGTARIYPQVMFMPFDELMELARKLSPRELTPEERQRYLHESRSNQKKPK